MTTVVSSMKKAIFSCILVAAYMITQAQVDTLSTSVEVAASIPAEKKAKKSKSKKAKEPKEKNFKKNWQLPYPNPYRAGIYSMMLPSAGQFYNRKYWKMPIVWGAFGGLIYAVDFNKKGRDRFNEAYGKSVKNLPHEFSDFPGITPEALRRQRNSYSKNLQLTYIGFVAMYALTAIDAYVDAHLKSFDISDDISLLVHPVVSPAPSTPLSPGLGLSVHF